MRLNTSLFICLFFSAIIAIKAIDYDSGEYESTETIDDLPMAEQDVQNVAGNQVQDPQADTFQYKPSKLVEELEDNMSDSAKEFVPDGMVKETLTETFDNAMATEVGKSGFHDVNHQWQLILEGKEASRVIGTFGQNFNTVFSSPDGADMINTLATTAHVLLAKAGEYTMHSGLSDVMSMMYSMFSSSEMPIVVNTAGELVTTAVRKPFAALFVKVFWDEHTKLLGVNKLNTKLDNYFKNIKIKVKPLIALMRGAQRFRRTPSRIYG